MSRLVGAEEILCVRFHSLGDVVLTTGVVRELARREGRPIAVATDSRFVPIFEGLDFVSRIWRREELPGAGPFKQVIDLQSNASSAALTHALGPGSRARHRSAARRWTVLWGDRWPRSRVPHVIERYAEAAGLAGDDLLTRCRPEISVTEEDRLGCERSLPYLSEPPSAPRIALLSGASRRSKAYDRFREVGQALVASGCEVVWVAEPGAQVEIDAPWPVLRAPLGVLKAALARMSLAVTNDSGPMHLAVALGVPVVAIFGSSVRHFGFSPIGPHDRVLEVGDLACRPCGVHGRNRCWLGHWRCLREIGPGTIAAAALESLGALRRNA